MSTTAATRRTVVAVVVAAVVAGVTVTGVWAGRATKDQVPYLPDGAVALPAAADPILDGDPGLDSTDLAAIPATPPAPQDPAFPDDIDRASGATEYSPTPTPNPTRTAQWRDLYPLEVSVGALFTHYRTSLDTNGWTIIDERRSGTGRNLTATKDRRNLRIFVDANVPTPDGAPSDRILVLIHHEPADAVYPPPLSYDPIASDACGVAPDAPTSQGAVRREVTDPCTRTQVHKAFTAAFTGPWADRARAVRGGDTLQPFTADAAALIDPAQTDPQLDIIGMSWTAPGLITVRFQILDRGQPIRVVTDGGAILVDGQWLVTRVTYCGVTGQWSDQQVRCPDDPGYGNHNEAVFPYTAPGFETAGEHPVEVFG